MKSLAITLIAAFAAATSLHAHCGTCSVDEMKGDEHADHSAHKTCYQDTLSSYFAIQKALASDDLSAAKSAASSLGEKIANSECALIGEDCCAETSLAAENIAMASDIAAARSAFLAFSNNMIAKLESHGSATAVFQMHCPMAFKNKGGSWLQDSKDLRNPYYGASMLTCGMQTAAYGTTEKSEHEHSAHSSHNH